MELRDQLPVKSDDVGVPWLVLDSSSLIVISGYFSSFRRDRATTGHPIHGGRWWWVSISCLDVVCDLVSLDLHLYQAVRTW